jgi:hypothetical protein
VNLPNEVSGRPFTYERFKSILERGLSDGFVISSFEKYDERNPKTLILRHDVDYTLNGVSQLAKIEARLGVSATYLFRVHAHEYNVFTPHVFQLIRGLKAIGHEVGLHFEAMTFSRALDLDPPEVLRQEKAILELLLGAPILTASEHRDVSHTVHGTINYHDRYDPLEAGFRNYALSPKYFGQMKYLSDSNGFWREGDPTEHFANHARLQVLVHPDWWFEKDLLLKGPYFHGLGN